MHGDWADTGRGESLAELIELSGRVWATTPGRRVVGENLHCRCPDSLGSRRRLEEASCERQVRSYGPLRFWSSHEGMLASGSDLTGVKSMA